MTVTLNDNLDAWRSAAAIEEWWATPSQRGITRPYSAAEVAQLRDIFPEGDGASAMGLLLRETLTRHARDQSVNLTISAGDGITAQVLSESGLDVVYASGGVSAMSDVTTKDPSTDLSDYTYDTVPSKVATLYRSQLVHARTAQALGKPYRIIPIIADGDSGFGFQSSVMKIVKLFVQAGVAGFHIDDLLSGCKRYDGKDGVGYVVVPLSEAVRRHIAAKLQLDIMGAEVVSIHRTDAETATHITSTVDPRDRPFILGASIPQAYDAASAPDYKTWIQAAELKTLDEAFAAAHPALIDTFNAQTKGKNTSEALLVAAKLAPEFYWSADAARTVQGWFPFRGGVEAATARAIVCAPYTDASWACQTKPYNGPAVEAFAKGVRAAVPGRWLAYNWTVLPAEFSKSKEVAEAPEKLAKLGYVYQWMPVGGMTAVGIGARSSAQAIKEGGVSGFLQNAERVQGKQRDLLYWLLDLAKLSDQAQEIIGTGL
ncbi:Isocitrate lyase [Vanrija pseudolonga]|uniref:methylisocitrate lyase n=1 Tax=Vanrija pseudolonga TaxID=143232 RepID=A0AAF1BGJ6_9TREE|nr:Isocitrate lyase [Vanrija pseudolonga]